MSQKKKIHLIGNAHLDPVWLWRWQEGYSEAKATFRSALDRMKEYPHFKFTSACSIYYKWIEETDPSMFEEIKARIKEGRWCLVGGWIIQPDCNLPSGESFARHSLYGQGYFKEKFGVTAKVGYNVDSFGHNGNIPKILRNSGMDSYVFMRPMPNEKELPSYVFNWESSDGSAVKTHRIAEYYCIDMTVEDDKPPRRDTFNFIENLENEPDLMAFYGVGNHGGGPTKELLQWMGENLGENFIYSTPNEYFDTIDAATLPTVTDDLQFHAKGCYSVFSDIKSTNRTAENNLTAAEFYSTLSKTLCAASYPKEELSRAWENLLFNQFHDVMGGCCIKAGLEDAVLFNKEALAIAQRNTNRALQKISWNVNTDPSKTREGSKAFGYPVVVFNPLPFPVKTCVDVDIRENFVAATGHDGRPLPLQKAPAHHVTWIKNTHLVEAEVPALGYTTLWLWTDGPVSDFDIPFTHTDCSLSNGIAEISFDKETGELISYKVKGEEILCGTTTALYDESHCDTWAHDIKKFDKLTDLCKKGSVTLWEIGAIRAKIRTVQEIGESKIIRDYIMYRDSDRVEVQTTVDFYDRHKMLKFGFNATAGNPTAIGEIPFGFMERPANGDEFPCGEWIALKGDTSGIGVATSSKYSFSATDNHLEFVVLRGAIFADHGGERTEFSEFMDMGRHEFSYVLFPYKSNGNAKRIASELLNPAEIICETFHEGDLPQNFSGGEIDAENVVLTAFKPKEIGEGYVVRLYETEDRDTDCTLTLFGKVYPLHFSHSEVKTLVITPDGNLTETNFLE